MKLFLRKEAILKFLEPSTFNKYTKNNPKNFSQAIKKFFLKNAWKIFIKDNTDHSEKWSNRSRENKNRCLFDHIFMWSSHLTIFVPIKLWHDTNLNLETLVPLIKKSAENFYDPKQTKIDLNRLKSMG